ncbi:unnamed protein product [Rhodiola kirilowii]
MVVPHHTQGAAELLCWYLITRKLSETVEAGVVTSSSRSIHHFNPLRRSLPQQQTLNVLVDDEQHKKPPSVSDSDSWVVSIRAKLDQACQDDVATTCAKLCIYKVPHYLREGKDRSYVPQIVSIGPYHHGMERLRSMERHKWRSLQQVLERTKHDVKIYLNGLKEIEDGIRACYEGPISFASNEFVEMMLLDGCFILEMFRGATNREGFEKLLGYARNDPIFSMRGSVYMIKGDLIMLENQLPLFVLDLLLEIQLGQPKQKGLVSKLVLIFFYPLTPTDNEPELSQTYFDSLSDDQDSLHCLEVFRKGLLRSRPQPGSPVQNLQTCQGYYNVLKAFPRVWMKRWSNSNHVADIRRHLQLHCVTELREAGIKFKRRRTDRFWDVKFKNGILKIPRLLIEDSTKSLFLNLIAFEQCHLDCSGDITSYVVFMDDLINSPEDVRYLHHCGIIGHGLGSDADVADLFNNLCQEVVFDTRNSYLSTLSYDVNKYFNHRWNRWRASLKHDYFSNPWAIISFFAAVILLLLTFAQTFYTGYGYYRLGGN